MTINNRDDALQTTADALEVELAQVVRARRQVAEQLSAARRNERAAHLAQHRDIKRLEYQLGDQLAQMRLERAIESGTKSKIDQELRKVNRLRSRLEHEDWLTWTRSIWKFKEMESDAKTGAHPAQFSAKVPERVIRMFSLHGDTILDPFVGSGTTCVEAFRLNRNSIGIDINPQFLELAKQRIDAIKATTTTTSPISCRIELADARNMAHIQDNSIQLVITHPPYWNCVKISDLDNDLSNCDNESYPFFLEQMKTVLIECFRVLEHDRIAAFMVGDVTRKVNGTTRLFPFHADLLGIAQDVGFVPWDVYVIETKMRNSGGMPMMGSYPYPHKIFTQFAHNYLLVLRKPAL